MSCNAREYFRGLRVLDERFKDICERYRGKYVAIVGDEIIADDDLESLVRKLKERGVNPAYTPIEYIPEKPVDLVV